MQVEAYSLADPIFFETPSRWTTTDSAFTVAQLPAPNGWQRTQRDVWIHLSPVGGELPPQGWKVHISACLDNADRVLTTVWDYCIAHRHAFKFLCSGAVHRAYSLKYAPRASSSKLITIYPRDEAALERVLVDLSEALAGEPGPYILSDLRWGSGPLYVRYGGFVFRYCAAPNGELVPAIERPDGTLVPDERKPVFHVPSWVTIPEFLKPHLQARDGGSPDDFPYQVQKALHFSNGGGVYLAQRKSDGQTVVLKEARPHAGVDGLGRDAIARLANERRALERLRGVPGVPEVYEQRTVWEHEFLVVQHMPGDTLQTWLSRNYPYITGDPTPDAIATYTRQALDIVARVERLLADIHARGLVFGDLHPANLLVAPDGTVSAIDFEIATDIDAASAPPLGLPGFHGRGKRGVDADLHALSALRLWIFFPLVPLLGLVPDKVDAYVDDIERRFDLPPGYADSIRQTLTPAKSAPSSTVRVSAEPGVDLRRNPDWRDVCRSMAEAIVRTATAEREDRLFPGDPQQFVLGGLGFAYGAAGVLWTLSVTGAGRYPEYEEWLLRAVDRAERSRPGFFDGLHGVAYVLDYLGYDKPALSLVEQAEPLVRMMGDVSVFSGLAGVGLNLLHLGTRNEAGAFTDQALNIADRLADAVRSREPHGVDVRIASSATGYREAGSNAGLLRGWSGVALFFVRLYEHTGDPAYLEVARRALYRDLDLCVTASDGALVVDGGFRTLPYLEIGSCGIALAAAEFLAHRDDERLRAAIPAIVNACRPEFTIESGMFNGRAGLMAVLAHLSRRLKEPAWGEVARNHLGRLWWHAVSLDGHVAFPGSYLRRLSMDVATGTSGVLLAVASVIDGVHFLPFLASGGQT